MTNDELERRIRERLAVPKYAAGRAVGWGRRATDAAVAAGQMPIIEGPRPTVPTMWVREKLGLGKVSPAAVDTTATRVT